jgi:hypothetical protein
MPRFGMGSMNPRRKQTRTARLVAASRRNLAKAHVMRVGLRGTRYLGARLPKPLRDLMRSKRHG